VEYRTVPYVEYGTVLYVEDGGDCTLRGVQCPETLIFKGFPVTVLYVEYRPDPSSE
jgi:hypothetical protein